jgi:hypothetical protein
MKIENKDFGKRARYYQNTKKCLKASLKCLCLKKQRKGILWLVKVDVIKIFGCGSGRELNQLPDFEPSKIVASDISENMIC